MKVRSILVLIYLISCISGLSGQEKQQKFKKTAACRDLAFDKKVDEYLEYCVPVVDVNDVFLNQREYIFLDAREKEEFNISHIKDARNVGYDDFSISKLADISKTQKIVVYCSIGYRSEKVAKKIRDAGYSNVFNLYGSLFEWVNRGYDLRDMQGNTTRKIHTYNRDWSRWVMRKNIEKTW